MKNVYVVFRAATNNYFQMNLAIILFTTDLLSV